MGRRHYGCKIPGCKIVRAYIRFQRTKWKAVGWVTTGCKTFQPDEEKAKKR